MLVSMILDKAAKERPVILLKCPKSPRTDIVPDVSSFRRSGNGVLFASDSAGEGIDLAGDILSSLIVVKLPFPVPDPVMEYQRNQYEDFDLYRRDIIIPEMLIKLRQWFGRGIRREQDTAVFSILDSRASLRGRYRAEILNTLPTMPVTDRLMDVADFIIRKKADSYFKYSVSASSKAAYYIQPASAHEKQRIIGKLLLQTIEHPLHEPIRCKKDQGMPMSGRHDL